MWDHLNTTLRQILTQAQYFIGFMYDQGYGVSQGDAIAQYDLALMYVRGRGVPQDDAEAVKWPRRAAEQGDADVQHILGFVCHEGQGVPQDNVQTLMWFSLAAGQGDEETMAYTRYVLEKGVQGDLLDLHVALAPCMLGYAEIGRALAECPTAHVEANPYTPWIDMYASDEYQALAADEQATMNRLMAERGGPGRLPSLIETFRQATRLEAAFWGMGMHAAGSS